MMSEILFICEGNICRSPMAQSLMASALPETSVASAGLNAMAGHGAHPIAVRLMAQRGLDISAHVAVPLVPEKVHAAEIVLTMTQAQRKRVELAYPFSVGKVYRVGHRTQIDIDDPYRFGEAAFEACIADLERALQSWLDVLAKHTA